LDFHLALPIIIYIDKATNYKILLLSQILLWALNSLKSISSTWWLWFHHNNERKNCAHNRTICNLSQKNKI